MLGLPVCYGAWLRLVMVFGLGWLDGDGGRLLLQNRFGNDIAVVVVVVQWWCSFEDLYAPTDRIGALSHVHQRE